MGVFELLGDPANALDMFVLAQSVTDLQQVVCIVYEQMNLPVEYTVLGCELNVLDTHVEVLGYHLGDSRENTGGINPFESQLGFE